MTHDLQYLGIGPALLLTRYAYPASAANTKRMQTIIQAEMAVMPSTLGEIEVTLRLIKVLSFRVQQCSYN